MTTGLTKFTLDKGLYLHVSKNLQHMETQNKNRIFYVLGHSPVRSRYSPNGTAMVSWRFAIPSEAISVPPA